MQVMQLICYMEIQLTPDIAPPSLSIHGSLWTEISCYTVFRFTSTLGMLSQTAVYEQWCYIGVWLRQKIVLNSNLPKDVWRAIIQCFQGSVGVCVYIPTFLCVE